MDDAYMAMTHLHLTPAETVVLREALEQYAQREKHQGNAVVARSIHRRAVDGMRAWLVAMASDTEPRA